MYNKFVQCTYVILTYPCLSLCCLQSLKLSFSLGSGTAHALIGLPYVTMLPRSVIPSHVFSLLTPGRCMDRLRRLWMSTVFLEQFQAVTFEDSNGLSFVNTSVTVAIAPDDEIVSFKQIYGSLYWDSKTRMVSCNAKLPF